MSGLCCCPPRLQFALSWSESSLNLTCCWYSVVRRSSQVSASWQTPSRCAKCSGKKCFTHFGCVTCWFHTFQLCYLLTRNFSVVSLDCSNWITVEPELAQTGMRKSLPLLAVLKHQRVTVHRMRRLFGNVRPLFHSSALCEKSLPCALDTVRTQTLVCLVLPVLFCFPTVWEAGYLTSCSCLFSSSSWFFGVRRFLSWTSWVCGMKGMAIVCWDLLKACV